MKVTKFSSILIITIILVFGLTVSFESLLAAWVPPGASPPGANLAPPIFSSSAADQTIAGGGDLWVSGGNIVTTNSLVALGGAAINGWISADGDNEGISVKANGNVGIGTINPSYGLDVVGDINLTGTLRVNGSPFSGSQWITSGANIYYNNGNVGIGTTNPGAKLDVNGIINIQAVAGNKLTSNGMLVVEAGSGGQLTLLSHQGSNWGTDNGTLQLFSMNADLQFTANNVERMRIVGNDGNVGIGTALPGLDVGMTGGLTINGIGATQLTVQNNNISGFALNVGSAGNWILYDKVGGAWHPSIESNNGQIHAFGDVCTDAGGGKCLSSSGGGGFGGLFHFSTLGGTCVHANPYTGGCSCLPGYNQSIVFEIAVWNNLYLCWK